MSKIYNVFTLTVILIGVVSFVMLIPLTLTGVLLEMAGMTMPMWYKTVLIMAVVAPFSSLGILAVMAFLKGEIR